MSDFIFIGATFVFFAICALYVQWCDKIIGPDDFPAAESRSTRWRRDRQLIRQLSRPDPGRARRGLPVARPRLPGAFLMSWQAIVFGLSLVVLLLVTVPPLGSYMATRLRQSSRRHLPPATGSSHRSSASSTGCAGSTRSVSSVGTSTRSSLVAFSLVSLLLLYALQRLQGSLPFNPTDRAAVTPWGSWNVAVSFVTNTNWQWYSRRSDDEPSHADDRPDGAELRVGCCRHGNRDRA